MNKADFLQEIRRWELRVEKIQPPARFIVVTIEFNGIDRRLQVSKVKPAELMDYLGDLRNRIEEIAANPTNRVNYSIVVHERLREVFQFDTVDLVLE